MPANAHGATALDNDLEHADVLDDARAPLARSSGERLGGVDRICLAILGQVHGADDVIDGHQRPEPVCLLGREHVHLEAEAAGHRCTARQLLHPLLVRREGEGADLEEAGCLSRLLLEGRVELRRISREAGEVVRCPELADEARGMPGSARCQLLAFEQEHVRASAQGQVVRDAAPDDTAADNDDLRSPGKFRHEVFSNQSREVVSSVAHDAIQSIRPTQLRVALARVA
jgi:hypothetical protein